LLNIIPLTVVLNKYYLRKLNQNGFLEMPYNKLMFLNKVHLSEMNNCLIWI